MNGIRTIWHAAVYSGYVSQLRLKHLPGLPCTALMLVLALMLFGVAHSVEASTRQETVFRLESVRTGGRYGPFRFAEGARVLLDGRWYRLHVAERPEPRLMFVALDTEDGFGPYSFVEGRIVEVAEALYAIVGLESVSVEPVPEPPRRSGEDIDKAWREVPGSVGPLRREARHFGVWLEPGTRTPMDWSFGGLSGSSGNEIETRTLGLGAEWSGWRLDAGIIFDASGVESLARPGLSVAGINIDDGEGWSLNLGYGVDLYREPFWAVGAAVALDWRRQSFDLETNVLKPGGVPVETNELSSVYYVYEVQHSDMTLRELALWAETDLVVHYGDWGGRAALHLLAFSDIDVSGYVETVEGRFALDARRTHPLAGSVTLWRRIEGKRLYADMRFGSERAIKFGIDWDW